mmetsp:Transcript_30486/g.56791  ORF Transcript_30486/g.56791 Transcript_30486/m.56791 type:complete len:155 (-) Transcript_30486:1470-1934(-)
MKEQRSSHHFEFFGIDVMADSMGECWLIEINRVPGLEASRNRCQPQEEAMFDEMMRSTLQMVLAPLVGGRHKSNTGSGTVHGEERDVVEGGSVFNMDNMDKQPPTPSTNAPSPIGFWRQVGAAAPDSHPSSPFLFKNLFNWKAFTSKNKDQLFV